MDNYRRGSHSVYLLTYHIIFVTKFRKKVITNEMGDFMKNHAAYLCGRMDCDMLSAETDEDHIHMLKYSVRTSLSPVFLICLGRDIAPFG
ncbi:IS200/IS605 family transposase [Butyrivibrio sp. MB2005]|uniref:IS200/IS605 family transposase n=1 Tax=Butyrivibrio sp. MB2005 TaxID=1280678 RepID=UPI0009DBCAB9